MKVRGKLGQDATCPQAGRVAVKSVLQAVSRLPGAVPTNDREAAQVRLASGGDKRQLPWLTMNNQERHLLNTTLDALSPSGGSSK